jgi:hypothetical protein
MKKYFLFIALLISVFFINGLPQGTLATPPGPAWPVIFEYKDSIPNKIPIGKPFIVSFSISSVLVDIDEIEISPVTSEEIRLIESTPKWKGLLKKGETKQFILKLFVPKTIKGLKFRIPFSQKKASIVGYYGICFKSKSLYRDLKQYYSQKLSNKPNYEDEAILERITESEKTEPVYEDCYTDIMDI